MSARRLEGKHTVITGAGSGIGQAIAERFASEGAIVEILERDATAAEATRARISEEGGTAHVVTTDVADQASVNAALEDAAEKRGAIDVLVNNAGIAHVGNLQNTSEEDLDRIYSVNVKGVYHCMHAVIEGMVARQQGVILNMASIASTLGIQDRFAYSMSKGAVLTMTLSVARDYVDQGIRCNCICPGRVHTPFVDGFIKKNYPGEEEAVFEKLSKYQPIGRMGKPEEIASLAAFLCSDEAAFITGSAYDIDGGCTLLR
ncbi:MAG: NAD(P)-dependent dehydrogenase (short-subunit alcohol dehydrogenase family) [Verrucomicrobiales bacterium]|jgi:NAD(P)-dependent dehydrogenase (short-subunit alcohol dehydrogenase family)